MVGRQDSLGKQTSNKLQRNTHPSWSRLSTSHTKAPGPSSTGAAGFALRCPCNFAWDNVVLLARTARSNRTEPASTRTAASVGSFALQMYCVGSNTSEKMPTTTTKQPPPTHTQHTHSQHPPLTTTTHAPRLPNTHGGGHTPPAASFDCWSDTAAHCCY